MKHYLLSDEGLDLTFDKYEPKKMVNEIINHLKENKTATVTHEKELSKELQKKYCGNEIINIYEVNPKNGEPSRLIFKGNKTFYKTLN